MIVRTKLLGWVTTLLLPALLVAVLLIQRDHPAAVLELLEGAYVRYGYPIVFLGSFLEAVAFVNLGVPGGTAVLLGASFAGTGRLLDVPVVILMGVGGAVSGYALDYVYGHFGHFPDRWLSGVRKILAKIRWPLALALATFHPNMAAYVAVSLGQARVRFWMFLLISILAQTVWTAFWTYLASWFGPNILKFIIYSPVVAVCLIVAINLVVARWNLADVMGGSDQE